MRQGSIDMVIDVCRENTQNDFYNGIAITGKVRRGKSNLGHQITTKIYPAFTYEKNYLGNPTHGSAFKRLFDTEMKSANWIDEAEKILSAERRWDKEQWWLNQLFNQFASHNKTVIFCTPSFKRIDSRWRDVHINLWIYVFARGKAILLKNRDIQSGSDVWGLKSMWKIEEDAKASDMSDNSILKRFEANPCSLFYFTFPDWEPKDKEEYLIQKEKSQLDLRKSFDDYERKEASNTNFWIKKAQSGLGRLAAYMNLRYQYTIPEIASIAGYAPPAINQYVSEFANQCATGEIPAGELPVRYFLPEYVDALKSLAKRELPEIPITEG